MSSALISALILLLNEAPQLIAGGEAVWNDLATAFGLLSKHGLVAIPADQLAQMNQSVAASQAAQAAAQAAAGPKPA